MPFHTIQINEDAVVVRPESLFNIWCNHNARSPGWRDLPTPHPPRYGKTQTLVTTAVSMEVTFQLDPVPPDVGHVDRYLDLGVPVRAGKGLEEGALVDFGPGLCVMVEPDGELLEVRQGGEAGPHKAPNLVLRDGSFRCFLVTPFQGVAMGGIGSRNWGLGSGQLVVGFGLGI